MKVAVFDLDGTLLDSDAALADAFVAVGVAREAITFGHVVDAECRRLGIELAAYLAAYDTAAAPAYPGVAELLGTLDRWAVCSNKATVLAQAELARLGWQPEVAMFAEDFGGPKRVGPVLERLGVAADDAVFVGDTEHDLACAEEVGVPFALAAWNPRAVTLRERSELVLERPSDLGPILGG